MQGREIQEYNGEKNTHLIQIKVKKSHHQRMLAMAESLGFNTLSDFIRFIALGNSFQFQLENISKNVEEIKNNLNKNSKNKR